MPEIDFRGTMSMLSVSRTPIRLSVSPKIEKSLVCSVMGQSSSEPGLMLESWPDAVARLELRGEPSGRLLEGDVGHLLEVVLLQEIALGGGLPLELRPDRDDVREDLVRPHRDSPARQRSGK